ncbi:hypothetical protein C7H19_10535 [Aphanothece hegewaldii CCALA 016]|uniref:Glyoxalase-like domain-containing protein n=1 Tax=Aphanothece hegewaldii CCALA 016 TaxID=2107694 RepID=A0A2T1LY93_9CHRO|nr:hypothetical protein [Aphanothece hegewaldii]PSF37360.1 hypothetical protein C7H19_10535 [Aphanothece hegewaldii CCALA 016]
MTTQLLMVNTDHALLEVDHLQIYTGRRLSDVFVLQELGLNNPPQTVRRESQGTVSTIFFFENAYLELISIEDEIAFRQYSAQTKMNLLERSQWQQTGASPFGIGLRAKINYRFHLSTSIDSTFKTEWGDSETKINFSAENLEAIQEPICFTIPHQIALTNWLDNKNEYHQELMTHPLGIKKLTGVKIKVNTHLALTNAVSLLEDQGIIAIERGKSPLLELTFDENAQNQVVDARPWLPILLRY